MWGRRKSIALLIFLLCLSYVNGSVVYTRLIDMSFLMTKWYDYVSGTDSHINFINTSITGERKLYTHDDTYTLNMVGTLTFSPYLVREDSSGGLAKGYFEGGATVTITGGLWNGATLVYGGTGANAKQIFKAVMLPLNDDPLNPTLDRWLLAEDPTEAGRFNRTLLLEMVEGSEGLASGLTLTTGDILKMTGPKMDLFLKAENPADFYVDMGPYSMASPIKITGLIPEPATVLLLGLGLFGLRKKR